MGQTHAQGDARRNLLKHIWVLDRCAWQVRGESSAVDTWSAARRPLGLLALGCVALLTIVLLRGTATEAPTLRAAVDTMMTLFALAAGWLLSAQFAQSRRLRDLLMIGAALAYGLVNFAAMAVPAGVRLHGAYSASAMLWGRLAVGVALAVAVAMPQARLVPRSRRTAAVVALLALAPLVLAGLGTILSVTLGLGTVVPAIGATGVLGYAASGFARRSMSGADVAAAPLAAATVLMASLSASSLLISPLSSGRIGAEEAVRLSVFALILLAVGRVERQAHAQLAKSAALAERRRVARDLHDGLAQDLAFIAAHGSSLAPDVGDDHPVVVAARRALAISRNTISELADPEGASTHESLEAVAQDLRERFDLAIAVDVALDGEVPPHAREHVTRIAREAIANAARHGGARNVFVGLRRADGGVALRVLDDGTGITQRDGDAIPEGFGLRSMRERAATVGGHVTVRRARRGGTELEVFLP